MIKKIFQFVCFFYLALLAFSNSVASPMLASTAIGFFTGYGVKHSSLTINNLKMTNGDENTRVISFVPSTINVGYMQFLWLKPSTNPSGPIVVASTGQSVNATIYVSYTGKIGNSVVNVKNAAFVIQNGELQTNSVITTGTYSMYCKTEAVFFQGAPYISAHCFPK